MSQSPLNTKTEKIYKTTFLKKWPEILYWILIGLLCLILGLSLLARIGFFVDKTNQWLTYPYFRNGSSEGLMLSEIEMIRESHSIYVPLTPDRFISAPYPPIYYYIVANLWSSSANVAQGFEIGRLVSLVSALLAALGVGLIAVFDSLRIGIAQFKNKRALLLLSVVLIASVGAALFLSMPAVAVWANRVRADMLMTALQLLGLVFVGWKPKSWISWIAIIPFSLAIYTKQTALAGPAAALLFLFLQNYTNCKRVLKWLLTLIIVNLLPLFIVNLITNGEFWLRLFKYHDLGWQLSNFTRYADLFIHENAALLIASVLLFIWTALLIWSQSHRQKIFNFSFLRLIPLSLWYVLFSLPILYGLGVSGADHNHFLPAEAATCCVGATLLGYALLNTPWRLNWWAKLVVFVLLIEQSVSFSVPDARYEIEFHHYKPDEQAQLGQIIKLAAANPLPILTSEAGFFVLTGKSPNYDDLFTLSALVKKNIYDQAGLLAKVKNKEFGLFLAPPGDLFGGGVRGDLWTPELLNALQANYQLKYRDVWFVYVPKP